MTQLTPDQITAALKSGIISADQAKSLTRIYEAAQNSGPAKDVGLTDKSSAQAAQPAQIGNEEDMRFVRSFSDVFIALGIILLAIGLSALAGLSGGGAIYLLAALIMAALAEYFGRRRKQNAPTLVTAIAFLIFVQKGLSAVMPDMAWGRDISVALITFIAMAGFYWRIRLPFCIALMALALFYLAQQILAALMGDNYLKYIGSFFLAFGIITFLAAMAYDVRDPERQTRFSDNAFWLDFIAAPLMLHGIFMQFFSLKFELLFGFLPMIKLDNSDAFFILLVVIIFTLIALAINRRIFMVATLGYAAVALVYLMHNTGLGIGSILALTTLFLGAAIIMLGVGWDHIRAGLLKVLPKTRFFPPAIR